MNFDHISNRFFDAMPLSNLTEWNYAAFMLLLLTNMERHVQPKRICRTTHGAKRKAAANFMVQESLDLR